MEFIPHEPPLSSGKLKNGSIRMKYGSEQFQFGDLRLPAVAGRHPIIVIVHGGGWQANHHLDLMDGLADDLTGQGFVTWNIEYRRVGQAGGGFPGTLLDVAYAVDFLRTIAPKYSLDLSRVITLGHSAGGHLALWASARKQLPQDSMLTTTLNPLHIAGVVCLAGVADLEEQKCESLRENVAFLMGGFPKDVPERYAISSPLKFLPLGIPQLVVHGTDDAAVPVEYSRNYVQAARLAGDKVIYLEFPGVEHFAVITPRTSTWQEVRSALQKL